MVLPLQATYFTLLVLENNISVPCIPWCCLTFQQSGVKICNRNQIWVYYSCVLCITEGWKNPDFLIVLISPLRCIWDTIKKIIYKQYLSQTCNKLESVKYLTLFLSIGIACPTRCALSQGNSEHNMVCRRTWLQDQWRGGEKNQKSTGNFFSV